MPSEWLYQYRQASFRGVEFYITKHSYKSGRRLGKHQYPNVDGAKYEDMGGDGSVITLSAYVVDGNYFGKRDALVRALEKGGQGRLVHPYLGAMTVKVDEWELSENVREGRVARFEINMVKDSDEQVFTSVSLNTAVPLFEAKIGLFDAIAADFDERFGFIGDTLDMVTEAVETVVDVVEAVKAQVATVAEYQQQLSTIRGKVTQLGLSSVALYNDIQNLIDFGNEPSDAKNPPTAPRAQFDEMVGIFSPAETVEVDPTEAEAPALDLIRETATYIAISSAAGLVSAIDFTTVDDALVVADILFTALDEVAQNPDSSTDMIKNIQDVRKAAMFDLETRILDLTNAVDIGLNESTPSLVVAHRVDGSIEYEQEIVDRNSIAHPGFIPSSAPVSVIIHE